jgi:hypothetical protein
MRRALDEEMFRSSVRLIITKNQIHGIGCLIGIVATLGIFHLSRSRGIRNSSLYALDAAHSSFGRVFEKCPHAGFRRESPKISNVIPITQRDFINTVTPQMAQAPLRLNSFSPDDPRVLNFRSRVNHMVPVSRVVCPNLLQPVFRRNSANSRPGNTCQYSFIMRATLSALARPNECW